MTDPVRRYPVFLNSLEQHLSCSNVVEVILYTDHLRVVEEKDLEIIRLRGMLEHAAFGPRINQVRELERSHATLTAKLEAAESRIVYLERQLEWDA